jgi:hypothetical protein
MQLLVSQEHTTKCTVKTPTIKKIQSKTSFIGRRRKNDVAQDNDKRLSIMNTVINMWFL